MKIKKNITGVVLAGGKSSRMGTDKGILAVNGTRMVEAIVFALKPVVDDIIIIANNSNYDYLGYKVYNDLIKDSGPLGGIYTALFYSDTEKNLVISCDTPFVSSKLFSYLIENGQGCDIAVPVHEGRNEPLCAIYTKKCANKIKELLFESEFRMQNVLNYFITKQLFLSEKQSFYNSKLFVNVNTPEELNKQKEAIL